MARLADDMAWWRAACGLAAGMRAFEARLAAEPEAVRAETLAWLARTGELLAVFRRSQGRNPDRAELAVILGR